MAGAATRTVQRATVTALVQALREGPAAEAEPAARALKHMAEADAGALLPHRRVLLALALKTQDLRVRWNLMIVMGLLPLRGRDRAAALDWLWERLADPSPLTRTFALQALVNLAAADAALLRRVTPVVREFAEAGTPAMRARGRRLLVQMARSAEDS